MSKIIPRFLYHITNAKNYKSIKDSGILKVSEESLFGEGVYTMDLTNLFKRWRISPDWGATNLQNDLLQQAAKDTSELVMLKIPTKLLNTENIRIRSQNKLFKEVEDFRILIKQKRQEWEYLKTQYIAKKMKELDKSILSEKGIYFMEDKFEKEAEQLFPKLTKEDKLKLFSEHLKTGSSVKERKLFQQRKEAIEYIYQGNIPISNVEKIGEVNISDLICSREYDPNKPMRSIYSALLRGTPQEKGALLLNC